MKFLVIFLTLIVTLYPLHEPAPELTAQRVLEKTIRKYDPENKWPVLSLKAHIQEPRPSVPHRYSVITMNAATGYFRMERNREEKIATYISETDGSRQVLIDGKDDFPEDWREKYRLDPELVPRYHRSYRTFYGLPMSLNDNLIEEIRAMTKVTFNHRPAYQLDVSLRESLFTKDWRIFIARDDFTLLGLEMHTVEEGKVTGEKLVFEGTVAVDGLTIPRMKHWYDLASGSYSGTDLLLKLLEE